MCFRVYIYNKVWRGVIFFWLLCVCFLVCIYNKVWRGVGGVRWRCVGFAVVVCGFVCGCRGLLFCVFVFVVEFVVFFVCCVLIFCLPLWA